MLEQANTEPDPGKRYQMLAEAEKYLLDQQPLIPLSIQVNRFLCKPYLKNFTFNSLGQINWREVYVDRNLTIDKLQ
jgi:oligopeptide transport system substrate-binding protein